MNLDILTQILGDRLTPEERQQLQDVQGIQSRVKSVAERRSRLAAAYQEASDELTRELNRLRADCKHTASKFHGDPSGGFDSWTECLICGAGV